VIKFEKGGAKKNKVPFVLFYDFESLQVKPAKTCNCSDDVIFYTEASEEIRDQMLLDDLARHSLEGIRPKVIHSCPHKTKIVNEQVPFAYHIIVVNR
jgi:hypothetical protein